MTGGASPAGVASSTDESPAENAVNAHFLERVVELGGSLKVQASEDIYAGNGVKLIAKGAPIDAARRDRLLEHKLHKPFEDCVEVVEGVNPPAFGAIACELLDRHPVLRALTDGRGAVSVPESLDRLNLPRPLRSMLSVLGGHQGENLPHSVGVAMVALGFARRLLPGENDRQRALTVAGLLHDVGELYLDPALLQPQVRLDSVQWRHIATHPIVGHRVLIRMEGAGPKVARPVLEHHERLDGFGYPRHAKDTELSIEGQILAMAECVMAFVDEGGNAVARAALAARLMPGEFRAEILSVLHHAAQSAEALAAAAEPGQPLDGTECTLEYIKQALDSCERHEPLIEAQMATAGPALLNLLSSCLRRVQRIRIGLSSAGLDSDTPKALLASLAGPDSARARLDVVSIASELRWRLRELERDWLLRADHLAAPADRAVAHELAARTMLTP